MTQKNSLSINKAKVIIQHRRNRIADDKGDDQDHRHHGSQGRWCFEGSRGIASCYVRKITITNS